MTLADDIPVLDTGIFHKKDSKWFMINQFLIFIWKVDYYDRQK